MKDVPVKALKVITKSVQVMRDDGIVRFSKRGAKYAYYRAYPENKKNHFKDILFINGCTLPHPERYRVSHQMEQLAANGISVDSIFYDSLTMEHLKHYRGFVFFRCPVTDMVRDFIKQAKDHNKTCFFDIDDLVIDEKYTNQIEYVRNLVGDERALYDEGVNRMRETMQLCDYGITSTERLQEEMQHYMPNVYVNRNVASDEMMRRSDDVYKSDEIMKDTSKIVIGYFSGSITHNEDFQMVLPALVKLMKENQSIYLKIAGILDIPQELEPFKERLISIEFMSWRELPKEIVACDINIAPLVKTIFNEAKSENKWLEASLCRIPTVASRVGALETIIKDGQTGLLTDNVTESWYEKIKSLVEDKTLREAIGISAYRDVSNSHTTLSSGVGLTDFITSKLSRNIGFVLPSTDISGGVMVVIKHAEVLKRSGWDVTIIDNVSKRTHKQSQRQYSYRNEVQGFNTVTSYRTEFEAYFDTLVATLWATLPIIKKYPNVSNKVYFVQNYETGFYKAGDGGHRLQSSATYHDITGVKYITISKWCQDWLRDTFRRDSKYCPNGIDLELFKGNERSFEKNKKVKILIEGDSSSEYKNTDEAFRIVEKLDKSLFEISYLSYRKDPKSWYYVDNYHNRVPYEEVGKIYAANDILVKTSLLESFSYPPLEMMATGGLVVATLNGGNAEYLRDGMNCLIYPQGDIEAGVKSIKELVLKPELRRKIYLGGIKTAKDRSWSTLENGIKDLYS